MNYMIQRRLASKSEPKDNMNYTIREYNRQDWVRFIDFSDDDWHTQINAIGFSLKDNDNKNVLKTLLALNNKDEMLGFIYGFVLPKR